MNVLVTGANGFIGRALCKRMLADGYQVRGAVRDGRQMTVLPSGVERVQIGNIGPKTDWSKALAGIDGIVHLAARVHVMRESVADPIAAFRQVNVAGTERLARQAAEAGVKRLVYISSVKVNGEGTEIRGRRSEIRDQRSEVRGQRSGDGGRRSEVRDQRSEAGNRIEDRGGAVFSEKDVPEPHDPYAVSKWEAEQVLRDVEADTGLEVVILRPPLVYGPGVKANFLRLFKIVERGIPLPFAKIDNQRSFIYLDNMIDAIITCINHPGAAGQTFLISDGEDVSTPELIRRIALVLGKPARLFSIPLFLMRLTGKLLGKSAVTDRLFGSLTIDSTKIRRELEWKPPYTMKHGLKETAKWYKKNC